MSQKKPNRCWVRALVAAIIGLMIAGNANAAGTNTLHELQVYSIKDYGNLNDYCTSESNLDWKPDIGAAQGLTPERDPYLEFWAEMYTNCTGSTCAYTSSVRRENSAVTVNSMINDGVDDWEDADMVFFYGHNATIKPQWSGPGFTRWQPEYIGDLLMGWCRYTGDWINWGTSSDPYYYHWINYTQTDASLSNPYIIFYAYNKLTSVLPGLDYSSTGSWYTENTQDGSDPEAHSGKLDGDTEWIIAHGCQAVTTAKAQYGDWGPTPDSIVSCSLGVNGWKKTWDNLHMVLGHYNTTTVPCEPDLGNSGADDFASMLKAGDVIKDAYFDIHTCNDTNYPGKYQPSAISVSSTSCCYYDDFWKIIVCPGGGCDGDYMHEETWNWVMSDITGTYYTTSWRVAE